MVGKPDWGGPAISHGEDIVINNGHTLGGGGTQVTDQANFSRPGYQVGIVLQNTTAGGTAMPVSIEMIWQDSVTLQIISHQQWWAMAASRTNSHTIIGQGPTGGDVLTVRITNDGAVGNNLQVSVLVAEVSFAYPDHDWRTDDLGGMLLAGFGSIPSDLIANMPGAQAPTASAQNALITLALPLYSGRAHMLLNTASGTTDLLWNVATIPGTVNAAALVLAQGTSDAAGNVSTDLWLPRAQCQLQWKNTHAATENVFASITVAGR